jgi:hypothetical protein
VECFNSPPRHNKINALYRKAPGRRAKSAGLLPDSATRERRLVDVPASQKGNANERYFFWTGNGNPKTVVSNWQRSYGKLFKLAALKGADGTQTLPPPYAP